MALETSTKYRCRHDIYREALQLISTGPIKRSRVMGLVGLSFPQLKEYEARLIEHGIITVTEEGWTMTAKGKRELAFLKEVHA